MTRFLVLLVVFALGAGSGAGGVLYLGADGEPPLAHLAGRARPAADSTGPASVGADSVPTPAGGAVVDASPLPPAVAAASLPAFGGARPDSAVVRDSLVGALIASPADALPARRVAKIFGAMQPREAAQVLGQLEDPEVQTVFSMLNDRQVAGILINFPPERAAALSRASLRSGRSLR